jgi:streptogramin lyase
MDDARFQDDLRRYWDEIARGGPATPGALDPEVAAAIRRLHALPDVPPPDPIYARQLRETLMHATTISLGRTDVSTNPSGNGRTAPGRRPILPALPVSPARWGPAQFATALLVLVVLIGSLLAFGAGRPGPEPAEPAGFPAVIATPATPEPVSGAAVEVLWQTRGTPDRPFGNLGLPAVDPEGNVWVPDANLGQYLVFAPDGTFLEAWGAPDNDAGEFEFMCAGVPYGGIVFDATGTFYVADSGNFRIQKFGPDREFLASWGSFGSTDDEFACPAALALDAQGRVYVADQSSTNSGGKIVVFDGNGAWLATWTGLRTPSGIAIDRDGNAWVTDYEAGHVVKHAPDGKVLATWDGSESADRCRGPGLRYRVQWGPGPGLRPGRNPAWHLGRARLRARTVR